MSLRELLGIELPIIQAPMAGSNGAALAIAVSNAGGLGSLPCAMLTPDAMRAELRALAAGTSKPYLVNFFCHTPPAPDPASESRWRALLAPYYREYGLDPNATVSAPARAPFTAEAADAIDELRPPVVSFHFGLPSPELVARVRRWGSQVLATATSVAEGKWLEARGVDAIVAQGREAGGHSGLFLSSDPTGLLPTLELVTRLVREVSVPVIAAGGIGDAASVARALAAGAAGVQCGTAYLLCPEATPSAIHRAALKSDSIRDTDFTNLISGRPARGIVNRIMRELGPLSDAPPAFPLASAALAPLRAKAESVGRGEFSPLWSGMGQARKRQRRVRRAREDIRERLLDAALAEFGAKGFEGASTRAIAERIDAHQPQIHYHFESKDALWKAAVDHLFAELGRAMAGLDFGPDPRRAIAVDSLANGFAELIRRFVRFAAARPELNQIVVHEATAKSQRLRWMTERHVRPLYDVVRVLWRRLREAGIAAPIDDAVFHYVLVGAASLPYVNAPEARLLTGAEPTDRAWVEKHADGLVATFLPNLTHSGSHD